uniref:RNA polymerase alpha subunit n=1 Tax=Phyla nodiflora TaxID=222877 RepID=UPI002551F4A8|nr:RNA polymerase alpha subunit [Phyla nodiflora]WGL38628.1 RNA polymerase alpha subunit [Phyla nodiflora]
MVREKLPVSTPTLGGVQWKCVESKKDSPLLYYGRFILSPLMRDQADTIGIAMRRALLTEIEETCITRVHFPNAHHEYSTIRGIQESVEEILMNLKQIVLRGKPHGTGGACIYVTGPGSITAQDIDLPPSIKAVDPRQYIASATEPIALQIGLELKRSNGYFSRPPEPVLHGSFPLDPVFMPVQNVNYSIHSYGNGNESQEILFLEIWTNGSLTPKEALHEASRKLINLFIPFLHKEEQNVPLEDNQHKVCLSPSCFSFPREYGKERVKMAKDTFIDQLEFSPRVYNCLKRSKIYTLWDILSKTPEDLRQLLHYRIDDIKEVFGIAEQHM